MAGPVYRSRMPKASTLWHCLFQHFDAFLGLYEECYCKRYGFLRPIITEVVNKFLDCGDLGHGLPFRFASLLPLREACLPSVGSPASAATIAKRIISWPFPVKGRWFCPSCHQKKVQLFGALVVESILFPVPHRHYTLGIPKMLRPYFRYTW